MDLPCSNLYDGLGSVEERSSLDDGWIIFLSHVNDQEVSGDVVVFNLDKDVFGYPTHEAKRLVRQLQLRIGTVHRHSTL